MKKKAMETREFLEPVLNEDAIEKYICAAKGTLQFNAQTDDRTHLGRAEFTLSAPFTASEARRWRSTGDDETS